MQFIHLIMFTAIAIGAVAGCRSSPNPSGSAPTTQPTTADDALPHDAPPRQPSY
ncbi:MAG TPA: hypothetical protein VGN72_18755 [Tepidisphaeraceae bacterium]|nr:hypothetical protein [Tepidisphaeraceae bacterium]